MFLFIFIIIYLFIYTCIINFFSFYFSFLHVTANIDQPSLKVSLTDGLISAIINTQVTHVLNPLSVNVSLALIQSPSVIGVVCIGIHADVKILQITIDKQKVHVHVHVAVGAC